VGAWIRQTIESGQERSPAPVFPTSPVIPGDWLLPGFIYLEHNTSLFSFCYFGKLELKKEGQLEKQPGGANSCQSWC
jgi:hypothetical protein